MKRKDLQILVEKRIKSFNSQGFTKDELFSDFNYGFEIPYNIPKTYGVGIKVESGEREYTSQLPSKNIDGIEFVGRRIDLEISVFPNGNGHYYGDLIIRGPEFKSGRSTMVSWELSKEYPQTQDVKGSINRVLPESDYKEHPDHWDEYSVGFLTTRFYSVEELICSAVWVVLDRVDGEFFFNVCSLNGTPSVEFYVNKYGTVKFPEGSRIKNMIKK